MPLDLPAATPTDRPVAILVRHGERPPIPDGSLGTELRLTERGRLESVELGRRIGPRVLRVHASKVHRCVQTAEAILEGGGLRLPVVVDPAIGVPSTFAEQSPEAERTIRELGFEKFVDHVLYGVRKLPGLTLPSEGARRLREHALSLLDGPPGLHLLVTHDAMIAATVVHAWGVRLDESDWPGFLESAALWRDGGEVRVAYRERCQPVR